MEAEEADWEHLGEVPFRKWAPYPSLAWEDAVRACLVVCVCIYMNVSIERSTLP